MINVFIGNKEKTIGFKVSEDVKNAIEEHAKEKGFNRVTDYILTLIDNDFKESEGDKYAKINNLSK